MNTRKTKKTTDTPAKGSETPTETILEPEPSKSTMITGPIQRMDPVRLLPQWRLLCAEFDDRLNDAVNILAGPQKDRVHHVLIYFENIGKTMRTWTDKYLFEIPLEDQSNIKEFMQKALPVAECLKLKLVALRDHGTSAQLYLTILDYQSYSSLERSMASCRATLPVSDRDESPFSQHSNRSRRSRQGSVVERRRGNSRGNNPSRRPHELRSRSPSMARSQSRGRIRPSSHDGYESEDLLRELRRYTDLPPPWNKIPGQSVRQERLDVSRQVQIAGDRPFRGDVDDYLKWRDYFIGTIGDVRCLARHKVNALRKSLDSVLETVVDYVPASFEGYKEIVENLEKAYGGTFRQMARYDDFFDTFKVKYNMIDQFREYCRKTAGYKALLVSSGDRRLFHTPHIYRRLLVPLPGGHIRELQTWLHSGHLEPNAQNLLRWAQDRLDRMLTEKEVDRRKRVEPNTKGLKKSPAIHVVDATEDECSEPEEYCTSGGEEEENIGAVTINYVAKIPKMCLLGCSSVHKLGECTRFGQLGVDSRKMLLRSWKFLTCFRCLEFGHPSKSCNSKLRCKVCESQSHHTLLHFDNNKVSHSLIYVNYTKHDRRVCLPFVKVMVRRLSDAFFSLSVTGMIDTGSNVTIASNYLRNLLDTSDSFSPMTINTAGGRISKRVAITSFFIKPFDQDLVKVSALTFSDDDMFTTMEYFNPENIIKAWPHLQGVKVTLPRESQVDLLIGNDLAFLTTPLETRQSTCAEAPVAERSLLGWSIRGVITEPGPISMFMNNELDAHEIDQENDNPDVFLEGKNKRRFEEMMQRIEKSWELLSHTEHEYKSKSDKIAESIIKNTMELKNGRVSCGILWKNIEPPIVINNRSMALRRLYALNKMLEKNQEVKKLYHQGIEDWIQEGTIKKVSERAKEGHEYYLCHFPVVRLSKLTSKVRIVVDAAARFRGSCLNDYILPGPNLTNDIRRVVLRFRRHPYAITGDVQSMFTQIKLLKNERSYHRILWGPSESPSEYEFTSFTFGNTCSPSVAISAARFLASLASIDQQSAVQAIYHSTIVDDTLDSVFSVQEGIKLLQDLQSIYRKGGMKLRKIASNSAEILKAFPKEEVQKDVALCLDDTQSVTSSIKTLGINWDPKADRLFYDLEFEKMTSITKRSILSTCARIFDPCGLISPITVRLKLMSQATWSMKESWDSILPGKFCDEWNNTLREATGRIQFDRPLLLSEDTKKITIHIFSDASDKALGAVAYMTVQYHSDNYTDSKLLMSCSRVAPLRFVTIPRLELQAAMEAVNLGEHLTTTLSIDPYAIQYWTDSTDVLHWLTSASRTLKIFVASRVATIQRQTSIEKWNWVPTGSNPADLISRGCPLKVLESCNLWKQGPNFLRNESYLPLGKASPLSAVAMKEKKSSKRKQIKIYYTITVPYWITKLKRFSSWYVFVKSIAKIIAVLYRSISWSESCIYAMYRIIALLQEEYLPQEYKDLKNNKPLPLNHRYANLRPFYSTETKTLHASGRLSAANHLPFLTKFPYLIPEKTFLATIIVRDTHEKTLKHMGGIKTLISEVSSTFYIRQLPSLAKRLLRNCVHCKRLHFRPPGQPIAPLPTFRLPMEHRNEVFETSAMDCLGPLYTNSSKNSKVYILVITCTFYRAVHLELIDTLSTNSFLLAFDRFIASKNRPKVIISDNGRNFLGAWNYLEKIFEKLPETLEKRYNKIIWKFNTPLDPHKGGVFERIVGLTKSNLAKILRNKPVTHEELRTLVKLVEAALNNRPLLSGQQDIDDNELLTPNHFLRGSPFNTSAPTTSTFDALKQWKMINRLMDQFWKRFVNQYIITLNPHPKKKGKPIKISVGDVVLIHEKSKEENIINFPTWPIGRITAVYPGPDGIVRSVKVKFNGKELLRGITKIALLHD